MSNNSPHLSRNPSWSMMSGQPQGSTRRLSLDRKLGGNSYPFPETLHPLEGYRLIEPGLHHSSSSVTAASVPFLERLGLRTVINMGPGLLTARSTLGAFVSKEGIRLENPCRQSEFGGEDYDLAEEAITGALQCLLDKSVYPILIVGNGAAHMSARLVGCLRRLQHWSITAIVDEYRSLTATSNLYDINERFIERFDLDLVTLPPATTLPPWLAHHMEMLEEERDAEIAAESGRNIQNAPNIPAYRLNAFALHGDLVSKGCKYSAKKWLLDVDDE